MKPFFLNKKNKTAVGNDSSFVRGFENETVSEKEIDCRAVWVKGGGG